MIDQSYVCFISPLNSETDKCQIAPSWCSFNAPYPGYNPDGWSEL